jgi:small subunit ribosomal protein S20
VLCAQRITFFGRAASLSPSFCQSFPAYWAASQEELSTMPNLRSAKKRMRIEVTRRARNAAVKSTVRTYVTKARNAIASNADAPETEEAIRAAMSNLDRAVRKGVIHHNNAARRKSRLMARLNKLQAAKA